MVAKPARPAPVLPSMPARRFDYKSVPVAHRAFVIARTGTIRENLRRAGQEVVAIGRALRDVKARLEHGQFCDWLEAEFEWSIPTAYRYMQVESVFGQNSQIDKFAKSALYLLSEPATPPAARIEAIARAEAGEHITRAKAVALVEKTVAPGVIQRHERFIAKAAVAGARRYAGSFVDPIAAGRALGRLKEFAEHLSELVRLACLGRTAGGEWADRVKALARLHKTMTDAERRAAAALHDRPPVVEGAIFEALNQAHPSRLTAPQLTEKLPHIYPRYLERVLTKLHDRGILVNEYDGRGYGLA